MAKNEEAVCQNCGETLPDNSLSQEDCCDKSTPWRNPFRKDDNNEDSEDDYDPYFWTD